MKPATNQQLIPLATEFRAKLKRDKQRLADPRWDWYPYDTLANFTHLGDLLNQARLEFHELAGDEPVADIGCADGDLALFLAEMGCTVDAIDNPRTHHNGMRGVRLLAGARQAAVSVHEADLDEQWYLPREHYRLALLLGVLYHLKNPFYTLEQLSKHSRFLLLSTRIASRFPGVDQPLGDVAAGYLVAEDELNRDNSNFWIFTRAGLQRLLARAHWQVLGLVTKSTADEDERAFVVAESRYSLANVELLHGVYEDEGQGWRWTAPRFAIRVRARGEAPRSITLKIHVPDVALEKRGFVRVSLRAGGTDLGAELIRLSGDYSLTRMLDQWPRGAEHLDIEGMVEPGMTEEEGRELGIILASVEVHHAIQKADHVFPDQVVGDNR